MGINSSKKANERQCLGNVPAGSSFFLGCITEFFVGDPVSEKVGSQAVWSDSGLPPTCLQPGQGIKWDGGLFGVVLL